SKHRETSTCRVQVNRQAKLQQKADGNAVPPCFRIALDHPDQQKKSDNDARVPYQCGQKGLRAEGEKNLRRSDDLQKQNDETDKHKMHRRETEGHIARAYIAQSRT